MGCEHEPIVIWELLDVVVMHSLNTEYLPSLIATRTKIDPTRKVTDWGGAISPNKKKKETA